MATHARTSVVRLSIAFLLSLTALAASGNSQDYSPFNTRYPSYSAAQGCSGCHTSAPALNSYGSSYLTAVNALGGRTGSNPNTALGNIENTDSDGDGYRNIVEINALRKAYDASDKPTASVSLSSSQSAKAGTPGATTSYSVTVTNNGNLADSFTLGVSVFSGQSWIPTISGTANNVAAGSTASITVNVAVAGGASAGQTSTTRVTATSQANTSVTATPLDLITSIAVAAPRYVSAITGNNTGACTSAGAPCRTLTYAMAQASNGDTINVGTGTYNVALGEVFPINVKSGVQLIGTLGAERTIIDGGGDTVRQGLLRVSGNTALTTVRGFTLRNGVHEAPQGGNSAGGALQAVGGSGTLRLERNVFSGNTAKGYDANNTVGPTGGITAGGAAAVFSTPVEIVNNIFSGNTAQGGNGFNNFGGGFNASAYGGNGDGGALYVASNGTVVNNTFDGNLARGGNGGASTGGSAFGGGATGGAIYGSGGTLVIGNNIFTGNSVASGSGGGTPAPAMAGALYSPSGTRTHNLLFGNSGAGDSPSSSPVVADPVFHHGFEIGFTSPAAGAGNNSLKPTIDFEGRIRPNPPSIGAFEPSGVSVAAADFNGDGRSDIMYNNVSTGQLYRMRMNGMTISNGAMVYHEPNTAWRVIGDADFNGDHSSDLLWRNSSTGQFYLMPFDASGLPGAGAFIYTEANAAWRPVLLKDVNGDGKADMVWWNSVTGQVYLMLMDGFNIVQQGFVYQEPNTQWQIVGGGDFAGSGRQNQLLWRNFVTGQVYLQTILTSPGFSQVGQMFYNSLVPYKVVGIGDFNGDGRDDILWRHDGTGQVYMMLVSNNAIIAEGVVYTEPSSDWKIVAVGDYNGDTCDDILWRNVATGQVYMMLMNGMSIASQGFVYTEPNTQWRVLGSYEYAQ